MRGKVRRAVIAYMNSLEPGEEVRMHDILAGIDSEAFGLPHEKLHTKIKEDLTNLTRRRYLHKRRVEGPPAAVYYRRALRDIPEDWGAPKRLREHVE